MKDLKFTPEELEMLKTYFQSELEKHESAIESIKGILQKVGSKSSTTKSSTEYTGKPRGRKPRVVTENNAVVEKKKPGRKPKVSDLQGKKKPGRKPRMEISDVVVEKKRPGRPPRIVTPAPVVEVLPITDTITKRKAGRPPAVKEATEPKAKRRKRAVFSVEPGAQQKAGKKSRTTKKAVPASTEIAQVVSSVQNDKKAPKSTRKAAPAVKKAASKNKPGSKRKVGSPKKNNPVKEKAPTDVSNVEAVDTPTIEQTSQGQE